MFKRAQLEIKEILFLVAVHQSPPNSNASTGDFGRHINLHLTYSFQHQQQHHHGQQPPQLSPATCKSPTPSIYHNHGENIHSFPLLHVRKIHFFFFFFMKNSSLYRSTVMNLDSNWQCILYVKRDFDEMKKIFESWKRSVLYRKTTVNFVSRLGTIDGWTLARLDDVVDAERGLIAVGPLLVVNISLF